MRLCILLLLAIGLTSCSSAPRSAGAGAAGRPTQAASPVTLPQRQPSSETRVLMHNVVLYESPGPHLMVRWLRGLLHASRSNVIPSFDEPGSFVLDIQDGVIETSLSDLSAALNDGMLRGSPLQHVSLAGEGKQLKLSSTLHKGLPLPVEMDCDVSSSPDGRIRLHISKIHVLKIPVAGLLKTFDIKPGDLVGPKGAKGVEVAGNDIYFDPEQLLPEPRKRGKVK